MKHLLHDAFFFFMITTFWVTAMLIVDRGMDFIVIPRFTLLITGIACFASGMIVRNV